VPLFSTWNPSWFTARQAERPVSYRFMDNIFLQIAAQVDQLDRFDHDPQLAIVERSLLPWRPERVPRMVATSLPDDNSIKADTESVRLMSWSFFAQADVLLVAQFAETEPLLGRKQNWRSRKPGWP
jgi:hypothetical protein